MICEDFFFLGTRKEKQEKAGSRDLPSAQGISESQDA